MEDKSVNTSSTLDNLVQVGGVPALAAAFRSGRIDAFLLSPPLPQTLEREHLGQIIIRDDSEVFGVGGRT